MFVPDYLIRDAGKTFRPTCTQDESKKTLSSFYNDESDRLFSPVSKKVVKLSG